MKKKTAGMILCSILAGSGVLSYMGAVNAAEEQEFVLDPIYVTATRYEKKDLSIPASTEVFTREKLDSMDARSVMDVIANIPGFVMSESPSGNGYPGLRGITSHLNIMINGIPWAKDYYYQMGTMSTAGIERIEVVKGGSAVLYGSSATTGVINIITRKGDENRIKIGGGSNRQKLVSGYAGNKKFSVSYDYYNIKDSGLAFDNARIKTKYYRDNIKRVNYMVQFNPSDNWNIMYMHNEKNADTGIVKEGAPRSNWKNKTRYDMLQAAYTNKNFRAIAYYQDRKWDYNMSGTSVGIESGKYYGIDLQNRWDFKATKLIVGGDFEVDRSKNKSGGVWRDHSRNHGSIFFMTETPVSNKTDIHFGAREVFTGDCGNSFNPQLQILHKATDRDSFYINVNKSLLEPPLSRRYGYSATQLPNPDLRPEKGWTYEAGWKKRVNKNGMFKFDVYHMKITDRLYSTRLNNGMTMYVNAPEYKNTGAEISYEWEVPKGLSYGLGISYSDPRQISAPGGHWEDAESRLGAHAELSYKLGKASVNLFANYTGARSNNVQHVINVDLNAVYRMTSKDTLSLKIANVLDRQDPRSISGGSILPERNWLLSYEHTF